MILLLMLTALAGEPAVTVAKKPFLLKMGHKKSILRKQQLLTREKF